MGTLIVGVILIIIVAAIVRSMIKDKKMARADGDAVIVEVDAVAAAAVANRDTEQYRRVSREKEEILHLLRKRGFRVTKQRELILDIVFEHECASCKEIYYQAIQRDPGIGMATVYRMVNTLTDIGC